MSAAKTLILSRRDVLSLLDVKKSTTAVEGAFKAYALGKTQMPAKIYLELKKYSGDFRAMPSYIDSTKACAVKWVNVHPNNKGKGLPSVMGTIILSDPKTGFPLCIMDGTQITSVRTAAASAVASKYLAKKDSQTLALVGCGAQAQAQWQAVCSVLPIKYIRIWGYRKTDAQKFARRIKNHKIKVSVYDTIKECVEGAEVIVTITPSRRPIVKLNWLKSGAHINAIGADAQGKQELDPAILKKAKVVIDDWTQASHSGEINVALRQKKISRKDIYAEIGDIVSGKKKAKALKDHLTVFDSTGLAIQDAALAHMIYHKARRTKKGKWVQMV